MGPFNDPPSGSEPRFPLEGFGLFSPRADVGREPECVQDLPHLVIVIALV
jgi:hypothetical protein